MNSINNLAKWRRVFMNWQLGSRQKGDHEADAVVDHRELSMIMRAELNGLVALLIQKGVFSALEFTAQLHVEAEELSASFSNRFPGYTAADDGLVVDLSKGLETARKYGLNR